jgi:hypothetical protein
MKRKKRLTQAELKQLGVQPGLQAIRYGPDGERVTIRQLTREASGGRPSLFLRSAPNECSPNEASEGEHDRGG